MALKTFLKQKFSFLYPVKVFADLFLKRKNPQQIFTEIYQRNAWGSLESFSGRGSNREYTHNIRLKLPSLFDEFHINSILDLPCGDFNWMKEVPLRPGMHYLGADIVEELIAYNKLKYSHKQREFKVMNLLQDSLPEVDLVLCRDCLGHFSNEDVKKAVRNIKNSNSKYLLTTSFPAIRNRNILTGSFRTINLEGSPFHFPPPILYIQEKGVGSKITAGKYLVLWRVADLPSF